MDYKETFIKNIESNLLLLLMYAISLCLYLFHGSCYFSWLIPMLVYIFETKNEFVKKQSSQAIILFLIGSIFSLIMYLVQLALVPVTYIQYADITLSGFRLLLSNIISTINIMGNVIIFVLTFIAIIRVYNYNDYNMPVISDYLKRFRNMLDKIVGNDNKEFNCVIDDCGVTVGELIPNNKYKKGNNKK